LHTYKHDCNQMCCFFLISLYMNYDQKVTRYSFLAKSINIQD